IIAESARRADSNFTHRALALLGKKTNPGAQTPGSSYSGIPLAYGSKLALRMPGHEVVITNFRDLEPLIAVFRKRRQRVIDLLEVGIACRHFAVQFLGSLERSLHPRWRKRVQFGPTGEQLA